MTRSSSSHHHSSTVCAFQNDFEIRKRISFPLITTVWTQKLRKSKRSRHYSISSIDHFHSASKSKNSPLQRKIGGNLGLLSVSHMLSLLQSERSVLHVRFIHKTRGAVAVWKASLRLFISFAALCDCGEFQKISFSLLSTFVFSLNNFQLIQISDKSRMKLEASCNFAFDSAQRFSFKERKIMEFITVNTDTCRARMPKGKLLLAEFSLSFFFFFVLLWENSFSSFLY